jgi:hypothetical protein
MELEGVWSAARVVKKASDPPVALFYARRHVTHILTGGSP